MWSITNPGRPRLLGGNVRRHWSDIAESTNTRAWEWVFSAFGSRRIRRKSLPLNAQTSRQNPSTTSIDTDQRKKKRKRTHIPEATWTMSERVWDLLDENTGGSGEVLTSWKSERRPYQIFRRSREHSLGRGQVAAKGLSWHMSTIKFIWVSKWAKKGQLGAFV